MNPLHVLRRLPARRTLQRGMTLIELMVALVISLILSLAIFGVMATSESLKRTTTSVNDIDQAGSYAMYAIDKWVRSAGSGFAQGAAYTFGCKLFAYKTGPGQLLPGSAPPAPFGSVNMGTAGEFRMAPILIAPRQTTPGVSGQTSDALIVMSGTAGYGETPVDLSDVPLAAQLPMTNVVGFKGNDVILVANRQGATGTLQPCMVEQTASADPAAGATAVSLSGTYTNATIGTASLTSMPLESSAMKLGNVAGGNSPQFLLIGVGDNNTLFTYDLLQTAGLTTSVPVADGVFEMRALYGVDTDNDGMIDDWVDPAVSTSYSVANLMAGTQTASSLIQSIKAIRVGLILRTSLIEKAAVGPASLTLFGDIGGTFTAAAYTRTFTAAEQKFRYRTLELTIPLRNSMML